MNENNLNENNMNEHVKDVNKSRKILIIFFILIALVAVVFSVWRAYQNSNDKLNDNQITDDYNSDDHDSDLNSDDDNNSNNNNVENTDNNTLASIDKYYELSKSEESYSVDNSLSIKFIGNSIPDMDEGYKYVAEITINGKKINAGIFGNSNDKVIYSANCAASFNVKKINNLYFLQSKIAAQSAGTYLLVLNKTGDVVISEYNVLTDFNMENNKKYLTVTSYSTNPIAIDDLGNEKRYLIQEDSISLEN